MAVHQGGCYCGNITVRMETETPLSDMTPRACDCDYCSMHGATWISTPAATLEIEIQNEAAINLFEQGSKSARFWLCQRCGTMPAVTCDDGTNRRGAVNSRCMLNGDTCPPAEPIAPKDLPVEERTARWQKVWIQTVKIKDCWDVGL